MFLPYGDVLRWRPETAHDAPMAPQFIKSRILCNPALTEGTDNTYESRVPLEGTDIELELLLEEPELNEVVAASERFLSSLGENVARAKAVIARDLLGTYNGGWRTYDEAQEDGSYKSVENPELTAREFEKLFTPTSGRIRDDLVQVHFSDGGAFWGHAVVVVVDEVDWTKASAELFG